MKFITKLAVLMGIAAALLCAACGGPAATDAGATTDSGGGGGPPDMMDMRLTTLNIQTPTTLGIVNGILASRITDRSINILLKNRALTSSPTVEVGDGEPGMGADEYIFPTCDTVAGLCTDGLTACTTSADCGTSMFTASFDEATRNLETTSASTVSLNVGVDSDGDMIDDVIIALDLVNAAFDAYFDATYANIEGMNANGTSILSGALLVEDACAIDVDLGGGAVLNLLDILDGSGMGTNPPVLTMGMCAAGDGAMNIQPDTDADGDGMNDAYAVSARVAASTITLVTM